MSRLTIGRIVQYTLSQADADAINRRRTTGESIALRIKDALWPVGAQAHIGNDAKAGDIRPAIVVRDWGYIRPGMVNLQVFLDGNDQFWISSVEEAEQPEPGRWNWPGQVRQQMAATTMAASAMSAATTGEPNKPLPLYEALYLLCQRIEACGASVPLTNAVMLASDLMRAVGNADNPADSYAADRVRAAVAGPQGSTEAG